MTAPFGDAIVDAGQICVLMGVSENNFAEATLLLALVLQKVDRIGMT